MQNFAKAKDIKLQKSPPLHPASNPVETFMRPYGKAMKTGRHYGIPETESLKNVLKSYSLTPHPATGLPLAAMIFRHGQRLDFPQRHATDEEMTSARDADQKKKGENENKINGYKYRKKSHFTIGDNVLIRNYNKSRKFDTLFLPDAFKIIDMNKEGNTITVQQEGSGLTLCHHPDDLKR